MPLAIKIRDRNSEAIPNNPGGYARVIAQINQNNVTNIFGTLKSHIVTDQDHWRMDRQNPTDDDCANVQVQRNGVQGKSTIACVIVPSKYNIGKPSANRDAEAKVTLEHNARMSELAKVVREGLTTSAGSYVAGVHNRPGKIITYEVFGEFAAKLT